MILWSGATTFKSLLPTVEGRLRLGGGKRLYISTLSVAQLISVYQKHKTNEEIRAIVR
jgi:hypothetical protein